jgi:hypothetical protein
VLGACFVLRLWVWGLVLTAIHRYKLVRGALDFGGVVNRATARSRYGGSFPCFVAPGLVIDPSNASNSEETKIIDHSITPIFEELFCMQSSTMDLPVNIPFFFGDKRLNCGTRI